MSEIQQRTIEDHWRSPHLHWPHSQKNALDGRQLVDWPIYRGSHNFPGVPTIGCSNVWSMWRGLPGVKTCQEEKKVSADKCDSVTMWQDQNIRLKNALHFHVHALLWNHFAAQDWDAGTASMKTGTRTDMDTGRQWKIVISNEPWDKIATQKMVCVSWAELKSTLIPSRWLVDTDSTNCESL